MADPLAGAVEVAARVYHEGADSFEDAAQALLSHLASSPEGRAFLIAQVFTEEEMDDLLDWTQGHLKLRVVYDVFDAALELRGDGNE